MGQGDGAIVIKYGLNGDADQSGAIDLDDYFAIDSSFLSPPANPMYWEGDFNYDGEINLDDYFLIDSAFLGQGGLAASAGSVAASAPASAAVTVRAEPVVTAEPSQKKLRKPREATLFSDQKIRRVGQGRMRRA